MLATDPETTAPILVVDRVTKRFAWKTVLAELSLTVASGECLVIIGPNGAGKTTLLRILVGLTRPSSGTVTWFGCRLTPEETSIRARLGVLMHRTMLDPELTVAENLEYYARLYGLRERRERITWLARELAIDDRLGDRVRFLSRGLQQRAALARALLHEPPVLLLDEPDSGLDTESRERLMVLIERHRQRGGTVLMTTHAYDFAARVATQVIYLERGRVVWTTRSAEEVRQRLEAGAYGPVCV
ncbi:MAG: heme ABC exporter ATP-binding protein CcmA [Thermomicrobium sp.]|nr:heme ABC exporter ATP-binding protein CcmA [Thermomicrobium sp.]